MTTASLVVAAGLLAAPPPAPRGLWPDAPDQAKVLSATFLGGPGTEWLVGGGFLPDGTVVLAGNVAGPTFDLPGVRVGVVGADRPPPDEYKVLPVAGPNGGQKKNRKGEPQWEKPSWRQDRVTGFVALCTADLKRVTAAHRLPWASGTVASAAVGPDGAIYLAGRATAGIAAVGGDVTELPAAPAPPARKGDPEPACDHVFVARLTADGSKAEWVRHRKGPSDAPRVTVGADGTVRLGANREILAFDRSGKSLAAVALPTRFGPRVSVSPADGAIVVGGEHHSPTGREPWRCPTLHVYDPAGKLRYQLYDWGGPYVGMDGVRLVSDSAVRLVTHTRDGGLLVSAWSDGGNSVMNAHPNDVRTPIPSRGLGITSAGAGVLSLAYLVKIDPTTYRGTAKTLWGPTTKGIDSLWVDTLAEAGDGSVCVAGRSAWGLKQTSNRLAPEAEPAGHHIAVLNPTLDGVRFCAVVPGSGAAEVTDGSTHHGAGWGIVTGRVDGRERVLFVGGAVAGEEVNGTTCPTPTREPVQAKFGGGHADGYAVLLELAPPARPAARPADAAVPASRPTRASFEVGAADEPGLSAPAPGTVFRFAPDVPPWVTVDVEVRDRSGRLWPSLLCGRPVEGTFTYRGEKSEGRFTVACPTATQAKGDQSHRVLGGLAAGPDAKADVRFTLESLGESKTAELRSVRKGKETAVARPYWEAKGALTVAGKTFAVSPKVTCGFTESSPVGKKGAAATVKLTAWFTLTGKDLGLDGARAAELFDVRVFARGVAGK